jgi:hypothetical protein
MKTTLALAALWLTVAASGQEPKQPSNEPVTGTIWGSLSTQTDSLRGDCVCPLLCSARVRVHSG